MPPGSEDGRVKDGDMKTPPKLIYIPTPGVECKNTPSIAFSDNSTRVYLAVSVTNNPNDPVFRGHGGDSLLARILSLKDVPVPENITILMGHGAQGTNLVDLSDPQFFEQIDKQSLWDAQGGFMFPAHRRRAAELLKTPWDQHPSNLAAKPLEWAQTLKFQIIDWNTFADNTQEEYCTRLDPDSQEKKVYGYDDFVRALRAQLFGVELGKEREKSPAWLNEMFGCTDEASASKKFETLRRLLRKDAKNYADKHSSSDDSAEKSERARKISEMHLLYEASLLGWNALTHRGKFIFQYAGDPGFFIEYLNSLQLKGEKKAQFVEAVIQPTKQRLGNQDDAVLQSSKRRQSQAQSDQSLAISEQLGELQGEVRRLQAMQEQQYKQLISTIERLTPAPDKRVYASTYPGYPAESESLHLWAATKKRSNTGMKGAFGIIADQSAEGNEEDVSRSISAPSLRLRKASNSGEEQ